MVLHNLGTMHRSRNRFMHSSTWRHIRAPFGFVSKSRYVENFFLGNILKSKSYFNMITNYFDPVTMHWLAFRMRAIAQDDNEDLWIRRENVEGQPNNEVHNQLRGKKIEHRRFPNLFMLELKQDGFIFYMSPLMYPCGLRDCLN